jgi:hypothetical protein
MSFRKEKKFRLSNFDLILLKKKLIQSGLKRLYPSRIIFSEYLDTDNLQMFSDSEEGVLPRKKVRIRWYDKNKEKNLETKISSVEGRFKSIKKCFNNYNFDINTMFDPVYGKIYSSILIKYSREYYFLNRLRITIDTKIYYDDVRKKGQTSSQDKENVLEVKVNNEISDDYIEKVIPYPTSRFSKYCRGVSFLGRMI